MTNAAATGPTAGRDMVPLRRNYPFLALLSGGAGASLGTQIFAIANPLLVLARTGSPALAGIVTFAETAAMVVAAIPAGVVLDRFSRRHVLIVSETVRAVAAACTASTVLLGAPDVAELIAASVVIGGAMSFATAAQTLALRSVIPPEQLAVALTRQQTRAHGAALVGPPLAAVLYTVSHGLPYLVISVGYLLSAVSGLAVRRDSAPRSAAAAHSGGCLSGIMMLLRSPLLCTVAVVTAVISMVGSGLALLVVLLVTTSGGDPHAVGFVLATAALGGLLGTAVVPWLHRFLRPGSLLILLTGWLAALMACLAAPFGIWWYAVVLCLSMLLIPALSVMLDVLIYRQVPDEMRGRAITSTRALIGAGMPLGPVAIGALTQYVGPTAACLALSAVLASAAAAASTRSALRAAVWPGTATS